MNPAIETHDVCPSNFWSSPMNDFEQLVEKNRKKESSRVIHSAAVEHALVIFKHLLISARESRLPVRIISGSLDNTFYNTLVDDLSQSLLAGCCIEVIVLDSKFDKASNLVAGLLSHSDNGELFVAGDDMKVVNHPHFILVGDKKFRLELDHSQTKAIACFNDADMGGFLLDFFLITKEEISPTTPTHPGEHENNIPIAVSA